jgi:hypothetical protein
MACFKIPGLVDLLRNKKPVSSPVNDQHPGFVSVYSGMEALGEREG